MASALKRLGAATLPMTPMREQSTIYGIVDTGVSPEMDAEELMKTMEKDTVEKVIPQPDTHFGNVQGHVVHSVNDSYYDTLITKVDVQQGAYGQNMFYKMQVLHDQTKDMYVLWTRWGRVGDSGQHQKTPFPTADEAVNEFEKIFKSKTGNEWQERHNFEKKQGKYRYVH
jgi:predicted DNA-binding WGR domain protein